MRIHFLLGALFLSTVSPVHAKDSLRIVGSSTVFPYTASVAETFGRQSEYRTPIVESTGTGAGFKLFCDRQGTDSPDAVDASRPVKDSEKEKCAVAGLKDMIEVQIGFDGLVLAHSIKGRGMDISRKDLFLALAKQVPVDGTLVENPYTKWSDIDPTLPHVDIKVYGPPPTSGTRDAFVELVMHVGCKAFNIIEALPAAQHDTACSTMREDGIFVESGENDNLIVQRLKTNPETYGIFGFGFLDQNTDILTAAHIDGVPASFENISKGVYPVARSLFLYTSAELIKANAQLKAFLETYTSEAATGEDGSLVDKGLIPIPEDQRVTQRDTLSALLK